MMNAIGRGLSLVLLAGVFALPAPLAAQSQPQSEEFLEAIRVQDGTTATRLATNGTATIINARGFDGSTPLTVSVRKRSGGFVTFLLGHKADANLPDRKGDTPLTIAAALGWAEGARLLLDGGARVDATNRAGETPLIVAIQSRQVRVARLLLDAGANPDLADRAAGLTARDYARREKRLPELLRLIEARARR